MKKAILTAAILTFITPNAYQNVPNRHLIDRAESMIGNVPSKSDSTEIKSLDSLTESALTIARKDDSKRQEYLDNLLKGITIPFCDGVVYDNDGTKIVDYFVGVLKNELNASDDEAKKISVNMLSDCKEGHYDARTPQLFNIMGKDKSLKIFVGADFFNKTLIKQQPLKN